MSHAQTKQQRGASSSLESGDLLIWLYTANAATVTSPSELLLSAWIIASRPNPQQLEKLEDVEKPWNYTRSIKTMFLNGVIVDVRKNRTSGSNPGSAIAGG